MAKKKLFFVSFILILFSSLDPCLVFGQSKTDSADIQLSTVAIKAQLYAPFMSTSLPQTVSFNTGFKNYVPLPYLYKIGTGLLLGFATQDLINGNRAGNYNFGIPLPIANRNHTNIFEYNAYLGRLHRLPIVDKL